MRDEDTESGKREDVASSPPVSLLPRPRAPSEEPRSGPVTGAQIVRMLAQTPASPGFLADVLGLEESYVRRICRQLVKAGVLTFEVVPQRGTPPLKLYSLVPVPDSRLR